MGYNDTVKAHGKMMEEKGWGSVKLEITELHMMMISEVGEASDEWRKQRPPIYQSQPSQIREPSVRCVPPGSSEWESRAALKPEGEAIELADVMLRIMFRFHQAAYDMDLRLAEADIHISDEKLDNMLKNGVYTPLQIHWLIVREIMRAGNADPEQHYLARAFSLCERRIYQLDVMPSNAIYLKMFYNASRPKFFEGKRA